MMISEGCYLCHRALKLCKERMSVELIKKKSRNPDLVVLEGPYPWCLLDYPDTEDEILSTWESRASLWESHKDHFWIREFMCYEYKSEPVLYSKDDEGAFSFQLTWMWLISTCNPDIE
jgi:hypothetical protein